MKKYLAILTMTLLLNGCATHYDILSKFNIKGIIVDSVTLKGVDNAIVSFADIGIDAKRSKHNALIEICRSDIDGIINCEYRYLWGLKSGILAEKPSYDYLLVIDKAGYTSMNFKYNMSKEVDNEKAIQIDIGKAFLKPINR